jgi:hypothetical protein
MRPRTLIACGLLVVAGFGYGCATTEEASKVDEAVSCEERSDPLCDHPINRIVIPKLRATGLEPKLGDRGVVCRRLAIDLIGRIPTLDELGACTAKETLADRADYFMAMPEYILTQQRSWAEAIGFDTYLMWYGYAVVLDLLVWLL